MAAVASGVGLAYIVGRDGSPAWQVLRVLVVAVATVGVWALLRCASFRWRYGVALLLGLVAMPVGLGITVPFVAKTGATVMTGAGILCLSGGVVLVLGSGIMLVRETPRWWRLASAPVLAVLLLVACLTLGMAVAATNVPPTSLGAVTPADKGLSYRDAEFATADGVMLSGWLIASHNGAAVVLMHGAGSTRSAVLDHAVVLARHGYGVLLFDARGHGRSAGRAMDFGWYGDQDVSAAVSYLGKQSGVDAGRIAAIGMSMGGEEAIGAAAADPRIQAVVAEGATTRVAADRSWLSDEYGWRGAVQEELEALQYGLTDVLTPADPPIPLRDAVVAVAPRRVLLIAGGDVTDEPLADRYIRSGSPSTVSVWVVPHTGHTDGLSTHPLAWGQHVMAFLSATIGPAKQSR